MLLLFYSHDMKLGLIPYRHFIKAYGEPSEDEENNDEDVSDEEKAKVVRHYLGIIAQILIQNKRAVAEVFECDQNGIISAEEFVIALKRMGLEEIEHEHVMMMLEALQYEESEEICVSIEELEEILAHYGVSPIQDSNEHESSEHSIGHYKKISLLDSENYDSYESPEKNVEDSKKQNNDSGEDYESDYNDDFS